MSVTVETIMSSLNLDGDEVNTLIQSYLIAAENYVKGAIGEDKSGTFYAQPDVASLFDVAVIALTGSYYTYRVALSDTQSYPVDLTLNSVIGQLRGKYSLFEEVDNG